MAKDFISLEVTNELSEAFDKYRSRIHTALGRGLGDATKVVVGTSVRDFMRNAKGERRNRDPNDNGPLRILTGRLVRSLTGARTGSKGPESIYRLTISTGGVTLTFGSKTPYARIHEKGGFAGVGRSARIPGRPFLGPALLKEEAKVVALLDKELRGLAREVGF